jgi:membrane-bound metal-dependent hydrolase YbcI (DUF457 family)
LFIPTSGFAILDFVTHSLVGTGAARLLSPRREIRPQLCLSAVLGSLLQDADSWLYLLGPNFYGKYHRVVSHTVWGLALVALLSAGIAWLAFGVPAWRRFGWFVHPNLWRRNGTVTPAEEIDPAPAVPRARFAALLGVALVAAALHWLFDIFTGFGNLLPLWPWSSYDASLALVTSFDWPIFLGTLGWHCMARQLEWPRRREAWLAAAYGMGLAAYLVGRHIWGAPTVW